MGPNERCHQPELFEPQQACDGFEEFDSNSDGLGRSEPTGLGLELVAEIRKVGLVFAEG